MTRKYPALAILAAIFVFSIFLLSPYVCPGYSIATPIRKPPMREPKWPKKSTLGIIEIMKIHTTTKMKNLRGVYWLSTLRNLKAR